VARIRTIASLVAVAAIVGGAFAGCGSSQATPTLAPVPPPTPTPNPHLSAPVSVDQLYNKLKKAGLTLYLNTADAGIDGEPRKRLNLTYEGWPLLIAEYSSATALTRETGFDPARRPGDGDPAYAIVGENILVQYGLTVVNKPPTAPAARWTAAATRLVAVLDPLLGPLRQSSLVPLALPTAIPTVAPTATPSPTLKPKPTKQPKPTK
jgi:hypothetical protein